MTPESWTPGPGRPTEQSDELEQILLALRWAVPRTDADARLALDRLAAVAGRLVALAEAEPPGETPWDAPVQSLLAQVGFALDWWRPTLDDVDLDWTLNHQAHLSADLARIASAGARILDQYTPAAPPPPAPQPAPAPPPARPAPPVRPPSAVQPGPPPNNRVAAVFGSVPATDTLPAPARHRRPAYEFDAPPPPPAAPPLQQPAQPFTAPPALRQPPSPYAPPPPPQRAAFTPPIVWSGAPEPPAAPADARVRPPVRHRGSAALVFQSAGLVGAIAALCWWAVSTMHTGTAASGHPPAPGGQSASPAAGAAHPAASTAPAGAKPSTAPAKAAPSTAPAIAPAGGTSVTALSVDLLGGSRTVRQVALVLSVNTSDTGQVTVTVDYYGMRGGVRVAERTASWTVSGKTTYQIADSISTGDYCGTQFTLTASSGAESATQSTAPGC